MGADIHLYIEYDISARPGWWRHVIPAIQEPVEPFSREEFIKSFADGEFLIPPDYDVFTALAGVRRGDEEPGPLYEPRGFPAFANSDTLCGFYRYVRDADEPELDRFFEIPRDEAVALVAEKRSHFREHSKKPDGFVSDPDWHTPSWLTASEFRAALAHHRIDPFESSIELGIVQQTLDELESRCGPGRARVVFWFDN